MCILLLGWCAAGLPVNAGSASEGTTAPTPFSRTYKVDPAAAKLSLRCITGSVAVAVADQADIRVEGRLELPPAKIADTQIDNSVRIEIVDDKAGPVAFAVTVPPRCDLEVKCLKGVVTVDDLNGPLSVETTDGDIALRRIGSKTVTARSTSGRVTYEGDISTQGNYTFQSFNNSIDVTVPAAAAFQLAGMSFSGDVNLGGFQLSNFAPGSKRLSGTHGAGGATIHLTTHRGQIRFHKK